MNQQDRLKQQIVEAVSSFRETPLAVTCESIAVDFHSDNLVVTLRGATNQKLTQIRKEEGNARRICETA